MEVDFWLRRPLCETCVCVRWKRREEKRKKKHFTRCRRRRCSRVKAMVTLKKTKSISMQGKTEGEKGARGPEERRQARRRKKKAQCNCYNWLLGHRSETLHSHSRDAEERSNWEEKREKEKAFNGVVFRFSLSHTHTNLILFYSLSLARSSSRLSFFFSECAFSVGRKWEARSEKCTCTLEPVYWMVFSRTRLFYAPCA